MTRAVVIDAMLDEDARNTPFSSTESLPPLLIGVGAERKVCPLYRYLELMNGGM